MPPSGRLTGPQAASAPPTRIPVPSPRQPSRGRHRGISYRFVMAARPGSEAHDGPRPGHPPVPPTRPARRDHSCVFGSPRSTTRRARGDRREPDRRAERAVRDRPGAVVRRDWKPCCAGTLHRGRVEVPLRRGARAYSTAPDTIAVTVLRPPRRGGLRKGSLVRSSVLATGVARGGAGVGRSAGEAPASWDSPEERTAGRRHGRWARRRRLRPGELRQARARFASPR